VLAGRYLVNVALRIKVANEAVTQLLDGWPPESGQTINSAYCVCCSAQERLTRTSSIRCTGEHAVRRSKNGKRVSAAPAITGRCDPNKQMKGPGIGAFIAI
jgi:hypothetical protein